MKKPILSCLCFFLLSANGAAQKSVSELSPAHASALQQYLTKHPELEFLSEKSYDQDYLKGMREDLGARFTPFYQRGDFNHDGTQDFAVILAKDVPPKRDPDLAESHQFQYEVVVVIFNGSKNGTYRSVFSKGATAPLVCFINTTRERKRRLYFGIYETDSGFTMTPAGRGYIAEYSE